MKAVLVLGGFIPSFKTYSQVSEKDNLLIAVDRGMSFFSTNNILPDILVGDLDSIDKYDLSIAKSKGVEIVEFPSKKDKTDTELAIDIALEKKATHITILGAMGTRIDHFMATAMLLVKYSSINIAIVDENNIVSLIKTNDKINLEKALLKYTSIIPISNSGISLSMEGFAYDLTNMHIPQGSTLGVSNELRQDTAEIILHEGLALLIRSKD